MATLSREQYDSIMFRYGQRRRARLSEIESRRRRVYASIPEYQKLDESVPTKAMDALRARLSGGSEKDCRGEISEISAKKRSLLRMHGFPEDYLEVPFACPLCRDTGYVNGEKCVCFKKEEVRLLYDQSNVEILSRTACFENLSEEFYTGEALDNFRRARAAALRFVSAFGREFRNLYFYGPVGTGKSFLSVCVAAKVLEAGYSVLYFSAASMFDRLSSLCYDYRLREEYRSFTEDLHSCDLLIIDDLGTELPSQTVSAQLFTCINERALRQKATIISTNLSLEDLQKNYSDRVFSRITNGYELCKLTGKDIRLLKKVRTINGTNQKTRQTQS